MAWAQTVGIAKVEVQVDDGDWAEATLGRPGHGGHVAAVVVRVGRHVGQPLPAVRATDQTGELQTDERADPIPDGASGWHQILVLVD